MRGLEVWIDKHELLVGDSLLERVGDGISDGDFVLAIISPHSIDSAWCRKELRLAATRGLSEDRVIVLPVQRGGVSMPNYLTDTFYARDDDPGLLADQISAAVRGQIERARRDGIGPDSLADVITSDDALLRMLGIADVPEPAKAFVAGAFASEVFDRVGDRVFDQVDEAQLASLDELGEDPDEIKLWNWLQTHVPNFAALWLEEASGVAFEYQQFAEGDSADPEAWARSVAEAAQLRKQQLELLAGEGDSAEYLTAQFAVAWGLPGIVDEAYLASVGLAGLFAAARSPRWDGATWESRRESLIGSVNYHVRDRLFDILDRSQLREIASVLGRHRDERATLLGWLTTNVPRFPKMVEEALHHDVADMVMSEVEARTAESSDAFIAMLVERHVDWLDPSASYGDPRKRALYAWMRQVSALTDFVEAIGTAGSTVRQARATLADLAAMLELVPAPDSDYYVCYLLSAQVWNRLNSSLVDGAAERVCVLLEESNFPDLFSWLAEQASLRIEEIFVEELLAVGHILQEGVESSD